MTLCLHRFINEHQRTFAAGRKIWPQFLEQSLYKRERDQNHGIVVRCRVIDYQVSHDASIVRRCYPKGRIEGVSIYGRQANRRNRVSSCAI